ncbi:EscU/YscU/HrcU family type III secretion system export apparatus switch protein [Novosphingobium sp. B 225]|uniref:EscU/YscU/HrcU family type III secretion system export apparatus switch protein n=1 Tax=Novosphingobium sp. B 225 TaxID=1961849 RepID=UPI000B4AA849|nr:EscU/YscU/HrcU family type III secretion system export apparatus switch protein [Novosphingobium sp. B 225]
MDESETDKSEAATPFKLQKARERGATARSMDLGFFAAIAAMIGFLAFGGERLAQAMSRSTREALALAPAISGNPASLGEVATRAAAPLVWPLTVFAGTLFLLALVLDFLQVGPMFSTHPLKPDFSKINPAKGLKRLFSWRMLTEAFKAVLKLAVYSTIAWLVIKGALVGTAAALPGGVELADAMLAGVRRLLMFFALAALGFAMLDQVLVRRQFAKQMRMSRREVKREHRDREGDPRFKQKRRQAHSEFAKAVKALRDVRGSDVIITNPTHYAVALRYDPQTMAAPQVVARGAGEMAARIRRVGFTYGVLALSDPPLARALYRAGRIGGDIPAELYQAVADIYLKHGIGANRARAAAA